MFPFLVDRDSVSRTIVRCSRMTLSAKLAAISCAVRAIFGDDGRMWTAYTAAGRAGCLRRPSRSGDRRRWTFSQIFTSGSPMGPCRTMFGQLMRGRIIHLYRCPAALADSPRSIAEHK